MKRCTLWLLLLSTVLLPLSALAQEEAGLSAPRPAVYFERVDVNLVTIDVLVTDRQGNPVTDLAKEDFRVLENGRAVLLTNFLAFRSEDSTTGPHDGGSVPSGSDPVGEALARPGSQKLYLVVYVDQTTLRPPDRNRVLDELEEFLALRTGPDTPVLVASHLRSLEVRQPFTDDPELVTQALEQLQTETGLAIQRDHERRQMIQEIQEAAAAEGVRERLYQYAEAVHNSTESSLRALAELIQFLPGVESRKTILYVGRGWPSIAAEDLFTALVVKFGDAKPLITMRGYNSDSWIAEVARQANANRVSIYALDAAGASAPITSSVTEAAHTGPLPTPMIESIYVTSLQNTLVGLSDETGGRVILGANRVGPALQLLVGDFSSYYSLGYQPTSSGSGEYRKIRVEVDREGLRVRNRQGYLDRTHTALMTDGTRASLLHGIGSNPFGLDLRVSKGSATNENGFVASMELSIPLDKVVLMPNESFHEGRVRLYVGAADEVVNLSEIQQDTVPIRIPSEEAEQAGEAFFVYRSPVRLGSGHHRIAVGVWDEIGHASSFVTRSVEVGGS